MNVGKFLLAGAVVPALLVASIAGCEPARQTSLQEQIHAREKIVEEQKAQIAELEKFKSNIKEIVNFLFTELDECPRKLAALEKENKDLKKKLRLTPERVESLKKSVEELKALQKPAAEKHRAEKAAEAKEPSAEE